MTNPCDPQFWLVWRRGGRAPVFEHATYFSAREEAERLARANPGTAFYVLAPAARGCVGEAVAWSHYQPTGIDMIDDAAGEHAPQLTDRA